MCLLVTLYLWLLRPKTHRAISHLFPPLIESIIPLRSNQAAVWIHRSLSSTQEVLLVWYTAQFLKILVHSWRDTGCLLLETITNRGAENYCILFVWAYLSFDFCWLNSFICIYWMKWKIYFIFLNIMKCPQNGSIILYSHQQFPWWYHEFSIAIIFLNFYYFIWSYHLPDG